MTPPLRVLVDARMCDGHFDGISRYVTCLLRALRAAGEVEPIALAGARVSPEVEQLGIEVLRTDFGRSHRPADRRWWWEQTRLPEVLRRSGAHLYHATWNTGVPLRCPMPVVLTIHDLIPLHDAARAFPSRRHRWSYRLSLWTATRRATRIVTVSEYVRQDCIARLGLPPDRVVTVYHGVGLAKSALISEPRPSGSGPDCEANPLSEPRPSGSGPGKSEPALLETALETPPLSGSRPYLLYVGGAEERKNIAGLVRAWVAMWRLGEPVPELWLTGRREQQCPAASAALAELAPEQAERVRFLGSPTDEQLGHLLTEARALVLLSTAEGFGLPVLEAMARGCPVVVSDQASLPEVVGDAGLVVRSDDAPAVAEALRRVMVDRRLRGELMARGRRRVAEFSWERTAAAMTQLYETTGLPARDHPGRRLRGPGLA